MPSTNSKASGKSALIAFVPVLHAGYVKLFEKYPHDLFLIGPQFAEDFPRLERDIRALQPSAMKQAIEALGIVKTVTVLTPQNVEELSSYEQYILPDEDTSHVFAEKYLIGKDMVYESVFLRWDKIITLREHEVPTHRTISTDAKELSLVREALKEGEKTADWWRQIGAVLVKEGNILFRAHSRHLPSVQHLAAFGDPRSNFDAGEHQDIYTSIHAEADIVAQAARQGISIDGASLYVSTFPCSNCARLLTEAGIKKIFYAKGYSRLDAEELLTNAGIEIVLVKLN